MQRWTVSLLLLCCGAVQADPVVVSGGRTVLPTSGLEIELPARDGLAYHLSGSWSLNDAAGTYDSRDVVDEKRGDTLVAGNWVMLGYFTAGECGSVVGETKLDGAWTTTADLWGARWQARGGVYTFSNSLGRKPAVVLCSGETSTGQLLLYRFLIDEPETIGREAMLAKVADAAVLQSAWQAFRDGRTVAIEPTRRSEVKNRGEIPPGRAVTLPHTGLALDIPDDGSIWMVQRKPDASTDMIDRMAPSLPEVTVEIARFTAGSCAEAFDMISTEKRPGVEPLELPSGWVPGPQLVVDGDLELIACRPGSGAMTLIGVFQGPRRLDVGYLAPLLGAIARAVDSPPADAPH